MFDVVNPATGLTIAKIQLDNAATTEASILKAKDAFPLWRNISPFDRASMLQAFAITLRLHAEDIAAIMTAEAGKPVVEALFEVDIAAATFEYYAGVARNRGGRMAPSASPTSFSMIMREPLGVVAAIIPWNYPILLWAWKAAPALAAGNCVVAKPSPESPLSLRAVADLMELPANVHSVVQGGSLVGETLVKSCHIAKVAFTGSTIVGKSILASCATDAKRSSVEMSGHDGAIVWDDVDIDIAVEAILFAAFCNGGQVCTSSERIYVRDTIFDTFKEKLVDRVRDLAVGDPTDVNTDIGSLVSHKHREALMRWMERAVNAGAVVETGGQPIAGTGAYYEPTVITGLTHEELNNLGEIFGPVAPLVPISSFEEGIAKINDNRFGLSANVLVGDLRLAMKAAREIQVGTVWINNPLIDNLAAPFGGFREAGIGRELGEEGFDAYTEAKHVWLESELIEQYYWYGARKHHLHLLSGKSE